MKTTKIYTQLVLQICLCVGLLTQGMAIPTGKDSVIVKIKNSTLVLYGDNAEEIKQVLKYDLNSIFADLLKQLDSTRSVLYKDLAGIEYRILPDSVITEKDTVVVQKDFENRKKKWQKGSPREGFDLYLGLNMYGKNDPGRYDISSYELRPSGSRFVALSVTESIGLTTARKTKAYLDLGLDVAWYNLMFNTSNTVIKREDQVLFQPLSNADGSVKELTKSKMTIPSINLSLMPVLAFKDSPITYVSAGVYGGYRIGGYTKTKGLDKKKEHVRDNYHLANFKYGVAFEMGIKNFPDLFFRYDLNELFKPTKGPDIQMISFGVRL